MSFLRPYLLSLLPLLVAACSAPLEPPRVAAPRPFPGCAPVASDHPALPEQPGTPQMLPFRAQANHALATDLTGNGLADVILTSHSSNGAAIYRQTEPRSFGVPQQLDAVGFHPAEWIRTMETPLRLLQFAEGRGELQSYRVEPNEDGGVELVLDRTRASASPQKGALARDNGEPALGVARYRSPEVDILRGFHPLELTAVSTDALRLGRTDYSAVTDLLAADLDGDGTDELLAAVQYDRAIHLVNLPAEAGQRATHRVLHEFHNRWKPANEQYRPHAIRALDINCDGWPDLLVTSQVSDQAYVMTNRGGFEFDIDRFELPDWGVIDVRMGADSDGGTYLLVAGQEHLALYRNPDFPDPEDPIVIEGGGFGAPRLEVDDLDGDGRLDAIITRLKSEHSNLILYGPLAEAFTRYADKIAEK